MFLRWQLFLGSIGLILSVAADLDLLILHTNDVHARFEQADVHGNVCTDDLAGKHQCYGGFARMKKAVDQFREDARRQSVASLFLNAGDTFQGTAYYTLFKWKVAADLVPLLGFDVMSLGNHEFDDGIHDLSMYLNSISTIPVVAANVNVTLEPELKSAANLVPSVQLSVGGQKVGVIGYLVTSTQDPLLTGNVIFLDEIELIRQEARRLKSEGVNIIIALGHSGFDKDVEIAREIPEISLVVGGHSHSLLYTPIGNPPSTDSVKAEYPFMVTQTSGRVVPVVQSFCNGKYLGKLRIKFNDDGDVLSAHGNSILLDSNFERDGLVLSRLLPYKNTIDSKTKATISKTNVYLSGSATIDVPETNLSNLIVDAFVDYVVRRSNASTSDGWTNAAIGILISRFVRSDIKQGNITYGDLLTAMPFEYGLSTATISGATLKETLEYSMLRIVSDGPVLKISKLLHLSGVKVVFDMSRPHGDKIRSLHVKCADCSIPRYEELRAAQNYTIVTVDFLLNGGAGFTMLKENSLERRSLGISNIEALVDYVRIQRVVYTGIDERVIVENAHYKSYASARSPCTLLFLCFVLPLFFT